MKLIEVSAMDYEMDGGTFKDEYHGNIVKDATDTYNYVSKNGCSSWTVTEEIANIMLSKGKSEQVQGISLIGGIGAKPKSISIDF